MNRRWVLVGLLALLVVLAGCVGGPMTDKRVEDYRDDVRVITVSADDGTPCYVLLSSRSGVVTMDCVEDGGGGSDEF